MTADASNNIKEKGTGMASVSLFVLRTNNGQHHADYKKQYKIRLL